MDFLSPGHLIVIGVVALVVLVHRAHGGRELDGLDRPPRVDGSRYTWDTVTGELLPEVPEDVRGRRGEPAARPVLVGSSLS